MDSGTLEEDAAENEIRIGKRVAKVVAAGLLLLLFVFVVIPIGISSIGIYGNAAKAKVVKTEAAIAELRTAIEMYQQEEGLYPPALETLVTSKIMRVIRTDGWGEQLHCDPRTGEVWSDGGPDGEIISSADMR